MEVVMIYEHQFFQRRHRYGKTVWSLQIDTSKGTVRVIERKSMKCEKSTLTWEPSTFVASGHKYEHRIASALMSKPDLSFMKSCAKVNPAKFNFGSAAQMDLPP